MYVLKKSMGACCMGVLIQTSLEILFTRQSIPIHPRGGRDEKKPQVSGNNRFPIMGLLFEGDASLQLHACPTTNGT